MSKRSHDVVSILRYGCLRREFVAAERGYIDDVIMPHSTRRRIARGLAMLKGKHVEWPKRKHDNLPV
jgi:acetyl-CoA carboxylase carboxyltransferase component